MSIARHYQKGFTLVNYCSFGQFLIDSGVRSWDYVIDTNFITEMQIVKGCFWGYIAQIGVKLNYYWKYK